MKKYIIVFIGLCILFGIYALINYIYIEKHSILSCTRENGDKVIIKFNSEGITNVTINGKEMESVEYIKYNANFLSSFVWDNMVEDKSKIEYINSHMKHVKDYEESNNAVCN